MMDIIEQKKALRKEILILKRGFTDLEKKAESQSVISQLELDPDFLTASVIFAFWPLNDEVDLKPLLNKWGETKKILLPKIVGKSLVLIEYKGEAFLKPELHFGILEPIGVPFTNLESINLVIVPGLAFDAQGYRLGRGGGYYDKLLPNLVNAKKIGVGFSFQNVLEIPCHPHDIKVDKIITGA
jgi:5-formyltetrahydrofolate cyclo-ligase